MYQWDTAKPGDKNWDFNEVFAKNAFFKCKIEIGNGKVIWWKGKGKSKIKHEYFIDMIKPYSDSKITEIQIHCLDYDHLQRKDFSTDYVVDYRYNSTGDAYHQYQYKILIGKFIEDPDNPKKKILAKVEFFH
jgi:hypothetical protein